MGKLKSKCKLQKNDSKPKVLALNRKQKRKEDRMKKKQQKNLHYLKKHAQISNAIEEKSDEKLQQNKDNVKTDSKKKDPIQKLKKSYEKNRKKMLLEANIEEEKNLKRLEKQLNLNKRKGKSKNIENKLPKSFAEDGLGYILEACGDGEKLNQFNFNDDEENYLSHDSDESDNSDENDVDFETTNEFQGTNSEPENDSFDQKSIASKDDFEDMDGSDSENEMKEFTDNERNNAGLHLESDEDILEQPDTKDSNDKINADGTWEDIYGRKRDSKGNVVIASKYIPPALRNLQEKGDLTRLEKQVKGQLNRLAESNMQTISRSIEDLYGKHSRNDMNQCLVKVLKSAIILPNALTPERLVMEHAVFIGKYSETLNKVLFCF